MREPQLRLQKGLYFRRNIRLSNLGGDAYRARETRCKIQNVGALAIFVSHHTPSPPTLHRCRNDAQVAAGGLNVAMAQVAVVGGGNPVWLLVLAAVWGNVALMALLPLEHGIEGWFLVMSAVQRKGWLHRLEAVVLVPTIFAGDPGGVGGHFRLTSALYT